MNQTATRNAPGRVKANGIELAYDSFGEESAQPLLLIMGLGCQMIAWDDDFCAQLAARGYRVLRFDNRDVGLSTNCSHLGIPDVAALLGQALAGQPVSAPYTLQDMAADTVGLLDALDIEHAHVVGASMGGAIAQTLAIQHPRRVRSLCSIMATSGAPDLPPPQPQALALLLTPTPTERTAYIERYINTWKVLRGPGFAQDEALDPQRASELHARGLNPPGVARQLAAILASGSRREALRTLRVPTLVLHGDADPLVPVACGIDVAQTVPAAKLRASFRAWATRCRSRCGRRSSTPSPNTRCRPRLESLSATHWETMHGPELQCRRASFPRRGARVPEGQAAAAAGRQGAQRQAPVQGRHGSLAHDPQ